MDFQDIVNGRRMVRSYSEEPVSAEAVDRMLRNAVRAPNAGFTQGWAFLVLDIADDVARFWSSTTPNDRNTGESRWLSGMRSAPVVIVPLSSQAAYRERYSQPDKGWSDAEEPRWGVPYWHVDAGMASLLVLQTAVDEGLGACFFGVPPGQVEALRAELGVPREFLVTGVVAVGHAADPAPREGAAGLVTGAASSGGSPTRRPRRPLEDVVHHGGW